MKVIKPDAVPAESADSPLFTGGPVTRQPLVTPEMGNNFNINIVNFGPGAPAQAHRRDESVEIAALVRAYEVLERFARESLGAAEAGGGP